MTVEEVAAELRVSKSKAYQIVRELNAEMQKQERRKEITELEQTISGSKEELSSILHQQTAAG